MPRPTPDLIGNNYGFLTVVAKYPKRGKGRTVWLCECVCGNIIKRRHDALTCSKAINNSCGCQGLSKSTPGRKSHHKSDTKIHYVWSNMRRRCYQKFNAKYPRYGGRGIRVCESWRMSFENFYRDMGDPPKGMTLGRIDNDGDYEPKNCRWETIKQQSRNTSQAKLITYKGRTMTHSSWSRKLGGNGDLVSKRIRKGWSEERAVSTPIKPY